MGAVFTFLKRISGLKPARNVWFWVFVPAYLIVHGVVATCLPERFDPLSTAFIVFAEWIAAAVCVLNFRRSRQTRLFWVLLCTSILIHSAAMSMDVAVEVLHTPLLNHVPSVQIFLSALYALPLLLIVSVQRDRGVFPAARLIQAGLCAGTGILIYAGIVDHLSFYGSRNASDEVVVARLFDAMDLYLAIAASLRWLGSGNRHDAGFFRLLAIFLWLNTLFPALHNQLLEMIHVDHEERKGQMASRGGVELALESLVECAPVGNSCQRIEIDEPLQCRIGSHQFVFDLKVTALQDDGQRAVSHD